MLKSDKLYIQTLTNLKKHGCWDENPRTKWSDGETAHSKFITQQSFSYKIDKGEFPIPTIRKTAINTGIKELLAIYQTQTNTLEGFKSHGVNWWGQWMNEDGNLGTAYSYNLESHKEGLDRKTILVGRKLIDDRFLVYCGIQNKLTGVNNFSDAEIRSLKAIWLDITKMGIHVNWECFSNFLKDVRYLPQYHLAKEDNFKDWVLSREYYGSNAHSKSTSVFLKKLEHSMYYTDNRCDDKNKESFQRRELSRNQVVELLEGLKNNPYSRRHMLSLFNWRTQPHKTLVECAYENLFSVRKDSKGFILDQNLIQRSSDFITASFINATQYVFLGMMICNHLTLETGVSWRLGKFKYDINNLHCYDRHEKWIDYLLEQKTLDTPQSFSLKIKNDFFNITIDDLKLSISPEIKSLPEKLEIAE